MTYGDPNRDGIFGASMDQPMQEIAPGDPVTFLPYAGFGL